MTCSTIFLSLHVIYVPFPCMVMCIFDLLPTPTPGSVFHMCVCVWKISYTSPLNFPPLTWKLSPRSVTFPSWKTGSVWLPCVSHIFILFCHVSPWPPTLTCQQCRFVSEWNTSSEEGSWPKIKSVSLRWCCLNRWVLQHFGGFLHEIPKSAFSCASMICSIHVHCNSSIWQCELGIWSKKIYFDPNDCY